MLYGVLDSHRPAVVHRWQIPLYFVELGALWQWSAFFAVSVRLPASSGVTASNARIAAAIVPMIWLLASHASTSVDRYVRSISVRTTTAITTVLIGFMVRPIANTSVVSDRSFFQGTVRRYRLSITRFIPLNLQGGIWWFFMVMWGCRMQEMTFLGVDLISWAILGAILLFLALGLIASTLYKS